MSQLKTLLVGAALIAASLTALLVTSEWGLGRRADGETRWRYLLEDTYDRYAYQTVSYTHLTLPTIYSV